MSGLNSREQELRAKRKLKMEIMAGLVKGRTMREAEEITGWSAQRLRYWVVKGVFDIKLKGRVVNTAEFAKQVEGMTTKEAVKATGHSDGALRAWHRKGLINLKIGGKKGGVKEKVDELEERVKVLEEKLLILSSGGVNNEQ